MVACHQPSFAVYTADIPGRYRLCAWGVVLSYQKQAKETSISLEDSPSTKHLKRQLVWRHVSFVPRFALSLNEGICGRKISWSSWHFCCYMTKPDPWMTWNVTLGKGRPGKFNMSRRKRTWARWWLNKRSSIIYFPEGNYYQFDLRRLFKQMAENPPTLKSSFTQKVGEKNDFSRLLSFGDVVYGLLLKPASFFQKYKTSWPSLSSSTKRIPRNWQSVVSCHLPQKPGIAGYFSPASTTILDPFWKKQCNWCAVTHSYWIWVGNLWTHFV